MLNERKEKEIIDDKDMIIFDGIVLGDSDEGNELSKYDERVLEKLFGKKTEEDEFTR